MAEETNISWADHTFNPVLGCTRVSPACDSCYAAHLMETRMGRVTWGGPGKGVGTRVRTTNANWRKPLAWDRKAAKAGYRPFVFCASLADVFDNQWRVEWRRDLFELVGNTPNLVWLLLTKRPQNIVKMFDEISRDRSEWPRNAAIGTTVEDQERADKNIPALISAKKTLNPAFAFLSCEPLLGPINLNLIPRQPTPLDRALPGYANVDRFVCSAVHGADGVIMKDGTQWWADPSDANAVDWVITGGETDQGEHKARPTNPQWFRDVRDQAIAAGCAYHHKQNGEWVAAGHPSIARATENLPVDHSLGRVMIKVGKKRSGRELDGTEQNAFPAIRRMA